MRKMGGRKGEEDRVMGQERDNVRETNRSLRNVQTVGKDRRNGEWRWLGVQLVRGNRET